MKEILSSLRFVATANKVSPIQTSRLKFKLAAILLPAIIMVSTVTVFAQSNEPAIGTLSETPVLIVSEWKSRLDYTAVINSFKTSTASILAEANLQQSKKALYTGFDRLLTYMQADVESNFELGNIADKNYKKVVQEAPSDPILINMQMDEFAALYDVLINKLRP
jgi:hypothetical protein